MAEAVGPVRVGHLTLGAIHNRIELLRSLAADPRIDLTVLYESSAGAGPGKHGYEADVDWGTDLLSGYRHQFLKSAGDEKTGPLSIWDPSLAGIVARAHFDVLWIHGYPFPNHMLGALAQRARGGGVLLRETQTVLDEGDGPAARTKRLAKQALIKTVYGRCHGAYVSTQNERWFRRYVGPPSRLTFAPNEIDTTDLVARATERRADRGAARAALGLPADPGPVILWVGRFAEMKQPLKLLDAFREVRAQARCSLLMVGSGPLDDEVRAHIAKHRIEDVYLPGFLDRGQIPTAFAAADLLTLPSAFGETFGFVVIEALRCGLPVVVSDAVGVGADLVEDGQNGFIVPRRDVSALGDRLRLLVTDDAARERMAAHAPESVAHWVPERTREGMLEAIAATAGADRWAAAARYAAAS